MLDLKRQYAPLHEELLAALGRVLETQQFILGAEVAAFEKASAEQLGVSHALGCSSGTDALWLALAAAGIKSGEAVITTPFSFFASVSSILRAGATPVLADIDPVSFNLSSAAVSAVLDGPRGAAVRAILPVHLYGQTVEWPSFSRIARDRGLTMIEDAAQAWGAEWNGVKAGGLGDIAAFSFYPTKNLSAAGDAGMVTTNSDALAERVKMLRQHGMRRRYYHDELGWNTRMDGFQGAVLAVKLKYIGAWTEARRAAGRALSRSVCPGGIGRGRTLSRARCRFAARAARRKARVASVCDSRAAPRCVARVSFRAWYRLGDLLSLAAPPAGSAEGPGLRRGRFP